MICISKCWRGSRGFGMDDKMLAAREFNGMKVHKSFATTKISVQKWELCAKSGNRTFIFHSWKRFYMWYAICVARSANAANTVCDREWISGLYMSIWVMAPPRRRLANMPIKYAIRRCLCMPAAPEPNLTSLNATSGPLPRARAHQSLKARIQERSSFKVESTQ